MKVVFVVFPGITQLDFTGPAQVFSRLPKATLHVAARTRDPIATDCGFGIVPSTSFEDCSQADLICVPGGLGVPEAIADAATVAFVRHQAEGARYITSVCTGALILGAAGLLKGRRATTHWAYTGLLAESGATFEPGRVVMDGPVITGGGVTAGIDFALRVTAEIAGEEYARKLQLALEYDPHPPFDGGHPSCTAADLVERVRSRYQGQVDELRPVLRSLAAGDRSR